MAQKLDSTGTFIFEVKESGLSLTKNGFPQWVARLKATQKYIESAEEIAHFQKQGLLADGKPGYVDWIGFDEETVAYLVLFKSANDFSKPNQLLNYEQLQVALGWDGTEFDSLTDGTHVGKSILGRVEENEYPANSGKITLRVNWIDKADASPDRALKSVDASAVKGLSALLKSTSGKATVKAAASAPTKPSKPTTPATSTPAPTAAASSAATPTAASSATATPPTPAPKAPKAKKTKAPETASAPETSGPPAECTKDEAWAYVVDHKGDNEDNVVTDAWISASGEVAGDRDEETLTPADWARVRDTVLKDLAV